MIYVDSACYGCSRALQIAEEIESRHRTIDVRVLDVSETKLPEDVIAVPAYVLDGRLISLGNPDMAEIAALIGEIWEEEANPGDAEQT